MLHAGLQLLHTVPYTLTAAFGTGTRGLPPVLQVEEWERGWLGGRFLGALCSLLTC
jgi:hypothetical protein